MARTVRESLRARARKAGILLRYKDLSGRWRSATSETLKALLDVLEEAAPSGAERPPSVRPRRERAETSVPPVIVLRGDPQRRRASLRRAFSQGGPSRCFLRAEGENEWRRLPFDVRGRPAFAATLPIGCHELRVERASGVWHSRLVVAPRRLTVPVQGRRWGIFAPVYALRDERTWGCGDLTAFERLGEWAAAHGASVLATLPLLATFLGRPIEPSPYRPVSRRFWNELYLDPVRTEEFARSGAAQRFVRSRAFVRRAAALERRPYVDFRGVARLKREVLERMLRSFDRAPSTRRAAFARFVQRTDDLRSYARFRASFERDRPRSTRYHMFVQWLMDEQLREVASNLRALGTELYFDLPLGADTRGFDARRDAALFVPSMSTGSPPDPGVPDGQDWGFPPWHPGRLRSSGYRPWIAALAHHLRVARMLRIDHALGLHRVFWIPRGEAPSRGAYVRFPSEELYAVLVAEAARAGAEIVGEDLGTVPPELRPALRRNGLLRLFVAQLEWDAPGPASSPSSDSIASLNTHDHPPFAQYWAERAHRPLAGSTPRHRARPGEREWEAFRRAMFRLARSPARVLLVNLEDLWGERRSQNVPGRSGPRMFSRRSRVGLSVLERNRTWSEFLSSIDSLRRGGPRGR